MRTRPAVKLQMSLEADIAKDFPAFNAHARILRAMDMVKLISTTSLV